MALMGLYRNNIIKDDGGIHHYHHYHVNNDYNQHQLSGALCSLTTASSRAGDRVLLGIGSMTADSFMEAAKNSRDGNRKVRLPISGQDDTGG